MIILTGRVEQTISNRLAQAVHLENEANTLFSEASRLEKEIDRYRPIGATYPFDEKYAEAKEMKILGNDKRSEAQTIRLTTTKIRNNLVHELQKYVHETNTSPGCQTFVVTPDNFHEDRIWIYGLWQNELTLENYLAGPFLKMKQYLKKNGFQKIKISKVRSNLQAPTSQ